MSIDIFFLMILCVCVDGGGGGETPIHPFPKSWIRPCYSNHSRRVSLKSLKDGVHKGGGVLLSVAESTK